MGGDEQILGGVNLRYLLLVQKDAKNKTEVANPLYPIVTQCYPYISLDVGVFPTSQKTFRPSFLVGGIGIPWWILASLEVQNFDLWANGYLGRWHRHPSKSVRTKNVNKTVVPEWGRGYGVCVCVGVLVIDL